MRERGSMGSTWIRETLLVALVILFTSVSHAQERPRVAVNRQLEGLSLGMPMKEVSAVLRRQMLWTRERAVLCPPDGRRPGAATGTRDCLATMRGTPELH